MKNILSVLLFTSIALCQFTNDIAGWYKGAYYVPDGTVYSEGVIVVDEGTLAAESLDEVDFATHAKWTANNDLDDTGGNAAFIWSANQTSTLTQIQANLATAGVDAVWYLFTYTVTVTTAFDGDGAGTITTGFASSAVSLDLSAGTHSVYFKSKTTPVDFVISIVSGSDTEGTFEIDDVTLKEIQGGSVDISGVLLVRGVDIGAGVGASTDDQKIDVFSIAGDNVQLSLEDDGEATKTVDISTTTAVTANTAKVTDDDDGVDGIYGAGWNADTDSPEKDDVYDKIEIVMTAVDLNTAKTGVTGEISNVVEDTSPELGADLDLTDYEILLDSTPDTDHTSSGIKVELTAGEVLNVGDLGYQNADGEIYLADATDATKMPAMFMCVETASNGVASDFLMMGVIRDDTWTWTVGDIIYATITGTTGNTLSATAPVGVGEQVQVIGVATHSDRMTFTPSLVLVTI